METAELSYLGTVDMDGFPQIRAMANLRNRTEYPDLIGLYEGHDEDFLIYFATGTSSDKMSHIKANPKATVYFCDVKQMHTLLLAGSAEVVDDAKLKNSLWQDRWTRHFPAGVDDPEYVVLRFLPAFAKGWTQQGPFEFKLK